MVFSQLLTGMVLSMGPALLAADGGESRMDLATDRFRLAERDGEFHLLDDRLRMPIPIPREWLIPGGELAEAQQRYVAGFDYEEAIHSFPIGNGLLGLHLSSYEIQESGSAGAAEGRDVFLILDPDRRRLRLGLALPSSKWRVRVGGCYAAQHTRFQVGDVDCDRRLDLAAEVTRIACVPDPQGGGFDAFYRREPLSWYLQTDDGWVHHPSYDERLPCGGLEELPLVGLVRDPVSYVSDRFHRDKLLFDRSVEVPTARLTLRLPAEWRLEMEPDAVAEMRAYGDEARLSLRVLKMEEGVDLATWVEEYRALQKKLAGEVKDRFHHLEMETTPFRSRRGARGYRILFGVSPNPQRIAYLFRNFEGDVVQFDLELSRWETAEIWEGLESRLLGGVYLPAAKEWQARPPD